MATYNATLYKNTGFNMVDIPDSPALVETFTSVSASALYLKQNAPLTSVRIEKGYNDVKNCDYLKLDNMFYFITDIRMLNDNVCELSIQEDSLTSLGGASKLEFIDGWCERRSVANDDLFSNIIPENYSPKDPLELKTYGIVADYTSALVLLASTVDLSADWTNADIYVGQASGEDYQVTVPSLPGASQETTIKINTQKPSSAYGAIINATLPGYGLYNYSNLSVKANVKKLRALGLETVLVGCYKIPVRYVAAVNGDPDYSTVSIAGTAFISELEMNYEGGEIFTDLSDTTQNPSHLQYGYGTYVPKNKKVYAQFNDITVFSTSGDASTYRACDIKKTDTTVTNESIPFAVFANGAPNGTPFCRPKFYEMEEINTGNMFNNSVKGSIWANCPLVLTGASGSDINAANAAITREGSNIAWNAFTHHWKENAAVRGMDAVIGGVSKTATGIGKILKGDIGGGLEAMYGLSKSGLEFENKEYQRVSEGHALANQIQGQKLAYEISQNIVAPEVRFTQDVNLQLFLGNSFFAYSLRLSEADLQRFDNYLTLYGYATSEPLTTACFTGRTNFNFVQASGVSIENTSDLVYNVNNNRIRRMLAAEQLANGVRVWHVAPDTAKRFNNPITTP